jgi:hypothetical protein
MVRGRFFHFVGDVEHTIVEASIRADESISDAVILEEVD